MIVVGIAMIYKGVKAKELRMRIQRLKDGVLWIAAHNDEKVEQIIISAGTWNKRFYPKEEIPLTIEERTEKSLESLEVLPKAEPGLYAHWECLGYRPGFLKHPFSEDYRCSNCGYEAYWFTPMVCPNCHAMMRGE